MKITTCHITRGGTRRHLIPDGGNYVFVDITTDRQVYQFAIDEDLGESFELLIGNISPTLISPNDESEEGAG